MELAPVAPLELKPDPWQRLLAVGSILSVIVLGIGLFITNAANRNQQEATRQQQELAAAGQIADRFTQAIDQLGQPGTDKIDVRLGALYSLERIMRDSAINQPAVVEVIAAFIRVHAPAARTTPVEQIASPQSFKVPTAPVDIQAAVTVLGRRDRDHDYLPGGLNLAGTNLAGANLADAKLNGARLELADLRGTFMGKAQLDGAFLGGANLYASTLDLAGLNGAFLVGADLRYARLHETDLSQADLRNADLRGADMRGVRLTLADLSGADLRGAVNLSQDDVHCARTDDHTRLPTGVTRPDAVDPRDLKSCRPR
ncbi:pentapeptide repeat-containing protein [Micromonospora sp. R77]|uniref:pentapeptide repeat-containing protein n=1 Tax=Micromonospora sp. R77 TaxID=2925836 RepID=UPI001F60A257|nr:pentapeptide repeat-containing protein [Micromonospora sp. R77]MCI4062793.1 pentapeptide repeat-containing protein [Micromonospora sp. R77]